MLRDISCSKFFVCNIIKSKFVLIFNGWQKKVSFNFDFSKVYISNYWKNNYLKQDFFLLTWCHKKVSFSSKLCREV